MASRGGLLLVIKIGNDFKEGFHSLFYFLNQVNRDKNLNIAGIVTIGYHSNIRAQYVLSILKNMGMERKIPLIIGPGSFYKTDYDNPIAKLEYRNQFHYTYPDYPFEKLGLPFTIYNEKFEKPCEDLFDEHDLEHHANKFQKDDKHYIDFLWKSRLEYILSFHSESNPLTVLNIGDCSLLEMINPIFFNRMRLFLYTGIKLGYNDDELDDQDYVVDNNEKLMLFTHNVYKNIQFIENIRNYLKTFIMPRNDKHIIDNDNNDNNNNINKQDICGELLIKCALEYSKGHDIMEKQHINLFYDNMDFLVKENKMPSTHDFTFLIMKVFLNDKDKKEMLE